MNKVTLKINGKDKTANIDQKTLAELAVLLCTSNPASSAWGNASAVIPAPLLGVFTVAGNGDKTLEITQETAKGNKSALYTFGQIARKIDLALSVAEWQGTIVLPATESTGQAVTGRNVEVDSLLD